MKFFISIVSLFLLFPPAASTGGPHDEARKKALEERLSVEEQRLKASYARERDLVSSIEALDREIELKREQISAARERIRRAVEKHERIISRIEKIEKDAAARKEALSEKLLVLYKHARAGYARVVFETEEIDFLRRAVKYASCMIEQDLAVLEAHADAVKENEKEKSRLKAELSGKEKFLVSEKKNLAALEARMEEIVRELVNTHKEKEFYETAVKELRLASGEFKNTISAIEERASGEEDSKVSHAALMGTLPLPAAGEMIVPPTGSGGEAESGLFIDARPGAEVQAILSGKVEFSGPVKGYGQTVIINHGGMLYSISSHLGRRKVAAGQTVRAGDIIGTAGKLKGRGIVYFEIRQAGRPVDARMWFGIGKRVRE